MVTQQLIFYYDRTALTQLAYTINQVHLRSVFSVLFHKSFYL